jgi:hypothetical protein
LTKMRQSRPVFLKFYNFLKKDPSIYQVQFTKEKGVIDIPKWPKMRPMFAARPQMVICVEYPPSPGCAFNLNVFTIFVSWVTFIHLCTVRR